MIKTKRIYEPPSPDDGYRLLVDRIWPRGISKEKAALDDWMKDVSPSTELRKWFHHDPEKWDELLEKYFAELDQKEQAVKRLNDVVKNHDRVTLLYAAREEKRNNAVALKLYIEKHPL